MNMTNIFLSYSPKDKDYVKQTRDVLVKAGFRPWLDPNPRPGEDWRFEIDDAIRQAAALLMVVTPASMSSVYVTYEWSFALGVGVRVIPVIFKPVDLHPRLMTLDRFDFYAWKEAAPFWDYLTRELHRLLQSEAAPPSPPTAPLPAVPAQPSRFSKSFMPSDPGHWLVIRRGPNLNEAFRLDAGGAVTLGRDLSNNFVINDPEVSRIHLRFAAAGGGFTIEDMGSTNGTFINNQKLSGVRSLNNGDVIGLGDAIMLSYELVR